MKQRFVWFSSLTVVALVFYLAQSAPGGQSQSSVGQQTATPVRSRPDVTNPTPYRSSDGKITGWKVTIPGNRPLATPAVAEGKVFVGGGFGSHEFFAFDASSGERVWTYTTADDGPTAAVVEGGIVAFNTESCELEVITTNGKPLWKKWLGDPLMSMPAIAEGKVYMAYPNSRGDRKYYLGAFDLRTGKELWKYPLASDVITAPIIDHDRIYLSTVDGSMFSLNRADGNKIWQENKNATSAPTVWNGQVYFSRREETQVLKGGKTVPQQTEVVAARAITPRSIVTELPATRRDADYLDYSKRAYSVAESKSVALDASVGFTGPNKGGAFMAVAARNLGQATVHGIWAYQGSKSFLYNGRLHSSMGDRTQSVDPASGKVIWSRTLHQPNGPPGVDGVLTPPSLVNGKAFVGTSSGEVYALSAETGAVLWNVNIGEPISFQPAVVKGRVYVVTNQGSLFSLNTGDLRDDGWLMWGGNAAHSGLSTR
jgi:Ca-activated chloride channel family protein